MIFGLIVLWQVRLGMAEKLQWSLEGNWMQDRAEILAEKILALDPSRPYLLDRLFDIYVRRGDAEGAERTARRVFEIMPSFLTRHDYSHHLWQRGIAENSPAMKKRAILEMEWMARIDDGIEYHVNLGIMHQQAGASTRTAMHGIAAAREVDRDRVHFTRVHPTGPGERAEFYPEAAGKGVYGYLPGRYNQGLKDALVMRLIPLHPESRIYSALAYQLARRAPGEEDARLPAELGLSSAGDSPPAHIAWLKRIMKKD